MSFDETGKGEHRYAVSPGDAAAVVMAPENQPDSRVTENDVGYFAVVPQDAVMLVRCAWGKGQMAADDDIFRCRCGGTKFLAKPGELMSADGPAVGLCP